MIVTGHEDDVHAQVVLVSLIAKELHVSVPVNTEHATKGVSLDLVPRVNGIFRRGWELSPVLLRALVKGQLVLDVRAVLAPVKSRQILDIARVVLLQPVQVAFDCECDPEFSRLFVQVQFVFKVVDVALQKLSDVRVVPV